MPQPTSGNLHLHGNLPRFLLQIPLKSHCSFRLPPCRNDIASMEKRGEMRRIISSMDAVTVTDSDKDR
jgi:hypothetical protein